MPPRKRAASAPKPDPEAGHEDLETAGQTVDATPEEATKPEAPAKPKPTKNDPQPCTECFPAGWPDDATSIGCGHGAWNRDL